MIFHCTPEEERVEGGGVVFFIQRRVDFICKIAVELEALSSSPEIQPRALDARELPSMLKDKGFVLPFSFPKE